MQAYFVNTLYKYTLDKPPFLCYIIPMIKRESIFKVTIATCWETGSTRAEFIKASNEGHALRIASRLFGNNVISTEFACEDNLN